MYFFRHKIHWINWLLFPSSPWNNINKTRKVIDRHSNWPPKSKMQKVILCASSKQQFQFSESACIIFNDVYHSTHWKIRGKIWHVLSGHHHWKKVDRWMEVKNKKTKIHVCNDSCTLVCGAFRIQYECNSISNLTNKIYIYI